MTAYFLDRLPLPLNLNNNNNNNKNNSNNQIAREMTPDSIDNSISECSRTVINSNKHRSTKHHMKLFE